MTWEVHIWRLGHEVVHSWRRVPAIWEVHSWKKAWEGHIWWKDDEVLASWVDHSWRRVPMVVDHSSKRDDVVSWEAHSWMRVHWDRDRPRVHWVHSCWVDQV